MINSETTITNVEMMIRYLERVQIGFSKIIAYALETDMSDERILDRMIEPVIRICCNNANNPIVYGKAANEYKETYIKKISRQILEIIKKENNY